MPDRQIWTMEALRNYWVQERNREVQRSGREWWDRQNVSPQAWWFGELMETLTLLEKRVELLEQEHRKGTP